MRLTTTRRMAAACAAAALTALAGLTAALPAQPAAAASGSTLKIGINEHGATFNPFLANLDPDLDTIASIYPSLDWYDAKSNFTHYLADKWDTSADKLTWTFHLHPGLKWSDGKPITADDAAWTFNLIMHNSTAGTANAQLLTNFASVTAPDKNTVVIKTKKPQANMLLSVYIPIVPKHIWASRVKSLGTEKNTELPVVGYGPFRLTGYQTDQFATLKANKDFFLGAPKVDTLILQTYKDINAAVDALKTGEVDQVDKLTAAEYTSLEKDKSLYTYQQVGFRWTGVEVNPGAKSKTGKKLGTGNPLLGDQRVRTAIAYGINRATLVKKVLDGLGQVGSGYLPPAFPLYHWTPPANATSGYDPAKANQLLDQAGYRKGPDGIRKDPKTGKPLSFRLGIHSDEVTDTQIAGYLVGWMKSIGIKLNIQSQSNSALNQNLSKGDWDMLMDGWGTSPDPTYLLGIQTCGVLPDDKANGGQTDAFFCDKRYDQLYAAQEQEFDQTKRSQDVKDMQQILYRANDDIILYYQNDLAAIRKEANHNFITGAKNAQGFYPYQNYKLGWRTAKPASSSSDSGSSTGLIIGIVIAVVVVVGVGLIVVLRRRSGAADRA